MTVWEVDYAPVEAFFSDFYYPGLLADIFAGKSPRAPTDIAQKDRRQPDVKLSLVDGKPSGSSVDVPYVQIKVDVAEISAGKDRKTGSGAQDVRLFRNGTLVRLWRGDVLKGKRSVTLEERIPIVAGENRFTAYAFNRDNVKSADAALAVTGAESLKRAAKIYVLAVGVNAYANPNFNLRFAVADAEEFGGEWRRQQEQVGRYAETVVVPLLDAEATKANILLAIKRLVEVETPPLPEGAPKQLGKLKYANPEDGVVIYFAGHGTAHGNRFYLIPHDLGYEGRVDGIAADGLAPLLAHSISDRELEEAFERLNAGQLLMVLDACNSGQALEAEEKRRGPMNSKGLAQLAYEKGMYILTAAQSFQAAQEASQLGHGLLTFALVEEGLKRGEADREPKDGTVFMREWLNYATERVPQMQINEMKRALARGMNLSFKEEERGLTIEQRSGQRPRVFYRRELEAQPPVVAKPAAMQPKK
ncbi:MAG: caspase family protein [Acidobacteria bacterium]|nr:caspase family protein [Acidobacteriota bacterium]